MRDFIEKSVKTPSAVVESGRNHSFKLNEANVENIAVLDVMNATNKSDAVAKLVKIWENNNAKRALRGAGLTTMALSLAACGSSSEDDTPISQATYDAAVDARDAAIAARDAAVAAQATAEAAQADAEAAQADAESETLDAVAARDAAVAAQAVAETARLNAVAAEAAAVAAEAALQAVVDEIAADIAAAGFDTLEALIAEYDALANPVARTFNLTVNVDAIEEFTGTAEGDTYFAQNGAGAGTNVLSDLDRIDGGDGYDVFNINALGALDTTTLVGVTVANIEEVNVRSVTTTTMNTREWTGLEVVNSTLSTAATITAAATTDVNVSNSGAVNVQGGADVTISASSSATVATTIASSGVIDVTVSGAVTVGGPAFVATSSDIDVTSTSLGAANIAVYGGSDVNVAAFGVTGAGTITVGSADANASGDVVVTASGTQAGSTISAISVNGGNTVTVNQTAANAVNTTTTLNTVSVIGDAGTTAVTVNNAAAATASPAVVGVSAGVVGVSVGGAVTIRDAADATALLADTISTVTLSNFGATEIDSSALATLNVTGGSALLASGDIDIDSQSAIAPATALTINSAGGYMGAIDTVGNANYTTITVNSSAATTIADLTTDAATTSLNFTGAGATTLTANALSATLVDINVTGAGAVTLGAALAVGTDFDGGAGNDTITLTAGFTQGITMGGGNDLVIYGGAAAGDGSLDFGAGDADIIRMASADAVTASLTADFNATVSNFEEMQLSTDLGGIIDMNALQDVESLVLQNGGNGGTINNLNSGSSMEIEAALGGTLTVNVEGAALSATDELNIELTNALATNYGVVAASGVETINITADDATAGGAIAVAHTLDLTGSTGLTTVTVSGNNGFTLVNPLASITSFDASGVVANDANDVVAGVPVAGLAVTFVSANSTAGSPVTIIGGAGNDILTGNAVVDIISGGAGNDTITGGAGADMLTGGAGEDTFVFATGDTGITVATADTIVDFTTADDSLQVGFAGATAATIANGTAFAAGADAGLTAFIAAADAVLTAGAGVNDDVYAAWNVANTGNAYVVVDHNDSGSVDAGDTLIVLTGVNLAAEIALADFIV